MLLVQNEDKLVYKVEMKLQHESEMYYLLNLELVCGWDYVNPDENDIQGYVGAENFVEHVQYHSYTFYPMLESGLERLEEEGYTKVDAKDLAIENLLASL